MLIKPQQEHIERIFSLQPADCIQLLYLDAKPVAGGEAIVDRSLSIPKNDAVNAGVTLWNKKGETGRMVPFSNGANAIDIHSANLSSLFSCDEGTIYLKIQIDEVGSWTDGNQHKPLRLFTNTDNNIQIQKVVNNQIRFTHEADTVVKHLNYDTSRIDSFQMVCSYSKSNNYLRVYILDEDPILVASDSGQSACSASGLTSGQTGLFAQNPTGVQPWHGWIEEYGLWNAAIDAVNDSKIRAIKIN